MDRIKLVIEVAWDGSDGADVSAHTEGSAEPLAMGQCVGAAIVAIRELVSDHTRLLRGTKDGERAVEAYLGGVAEAAGREAQGLEVESLIRERK